MSNENINPLTKLIAAVVVVFAVGITALNCFTIVKVGSEASVSSFGKVHMDKNYEGFNLVMPWWTIDDYSLQHETRLFEDLGVASKDKFKTNMDVAFTGNFVTTTAASNRNGTGTASKYKSTHVDKRVLSCLTKAGGEVKDSQAFFETHIQIQLAESTLDCVNDYLDGVGGYKLSTIQFSDIRLDPRVQQFMVDTKQRQEKENQQASQLRIKDLEAQETIKVAESNEIASISNKAAARNMADAERYAKEQEAAGNVKLSRSITPGLTKYIEAQRWNGSKATTILAEGTKVLYSNK